MRLRVATRQSALALTQTRWVIERLRGRRPDLDVEEVPIVTQGDRVLDQPLVNVGGKGLFVSEVEAALSDGRADIAVHSLKDVPSAFAEGLCLGAVPEREDPRDVLVTADGIGLWDLTAGARVGTSSLRRSCQLGARRPDLAFATLRGNVDTRLRRLDEGRFDAIVLAFAGLRRLGLEGRPLQVLPVDVCIPAIGQGALAIEVRADDAARRELVAGIEHRPSRIAIEAERAFLARLEGSCKTPIAGHAWFTDSGTRLIFDGMVGSLDGAQILSGGSSCFLPRTPDPLTVARELGNEVAESLIARGARALISEAIAAAERRLKTSN